MKKERFLIIVSMILLISVGLLMIYSSSSVWSVYKFNTRFRYLIYQTFFLVVGTMCLLFTKKIDLDFLKRKTNLIFFISVFLLVLVLIPGIGKIRNGSRSWFSLGFISFQPSELMKMSLIMFTSKYLEKYHQRINNIKNNLLPLILIIFMVLFLIMLEPDFGSSMIIVLTITIMLFTAKLDIKYFIYLGIVGLLGISVIILIAPYRMARIVSFLNPWSDPLGSGYQIIQSLYAIGPGGIFGHGLFSSRQKYFYLPEPQTDFIFAILCEELGLIIAGFVIILFIMLFYNIFIVSYKESDLFKKFIVIGIGSSLAIQTVMNLSVVVGLVPVTGVTLPFLSYGGSSLLISMVSIGIILNISKQGKH